MILMFRNSINTPTKNNGKGSHSNNCCYKSCTYTCHIHSLNCLRYFAKLSKIKIKHNVKKIMPIYAMISFTLLKLSKLTNKYATRAIKAVAIILNAFLSKPKISFASSFIGNILTQHNLRRFK